MIVLGLAMFFFSLVLLCFLYKPLTALELKYIYSNQGFLVKATVSTLIFFFFRISGPRIGKTTSNSQAIEQKETLKCKIKAREIYCDKKKISIHDK